MRSRVLVALALAAIVSLPAFPASGATAIKPYAVPVGAAYDVRPLLSVADTVPEASDPSVQYQMIGIPDGLGIDGNTLYLNHELTKPTFSAPEVGRPRYRGAFVSKYSLDTDGDPVNGERAYDIAYQENTLVGPAPTEANTTSAFGRFCSGELFDERHGFDRPIYLTGEEADGAATFDSLGGQAVAIFDNEAHALPKMGRFSKENSLVMAGTGAKTVVMTLEDGPASPDSQLYMYVGTKDPSAASALRRNGLDNGKLYVFVGKDPARNSEKTVTSGSADGRWVEIPGAGSMTDVQLEAASDAANAYRFVRIEDGAFSETKPGQFFFVTTGSATDPTENQLGRLYSIKINKNHPTNPASLHVVYNADEVVAGGGDIALSPDNIDTSTDYLMINEDGTTQSRAVMASKGRDGSVWRIPLDNGFQIGADELAAAERVAELDPPGRDGRAVGPGVWETSGIIDTSATLGADTWITDVQAHGPTAAPAPNTVEDGQLLIMSPAS